MIDGTELLKHKEGGVIYKIPKNDGFDAYNQKVTETI